MGPVDNIKSKVMETFPDGVNFACWWSYIGKSLLPTRLFRQGILLIPDNHYIKCPALIKSSPCCPRVYIYIDLLVPMR